MAGSVHAGISVIDTTTQVTNHTSSSQWITLVGTPYTNVLYVATNPAAIITGDSLPTAFAKVNSNFVYAESQIATNANLIATLSVSNANWQTWQGYTNTLVAGSLAFWKAYGVTNNGTFSGILMGSDSSSGVAGYVATAAGDGTWKWQAGGGGGALPTNAVFTSQHYVTYATNYAVFGTSPATFNSNFLARVNGVSDWTASLPIYTFDLDPNSPYYDHLFGSYDGVSSWFMITNGFSTTNMLSVSVVGTNYGIGAVTLYSIDHPELMGVVNSFYGQEVIVPVPVNSGDAASKGYVDTVIANSKDGQFTTSTGTNGVFHYAYARNGNTVLDMTSISGYAPIQSISLDGTGTNIALTVWQTNLASGFIVQGSTNLAIISGFTATTNWTTNTVSGLTTIKLPINFSDAQHFYRILTSSLNASAFYGQVACNGGTLYPSNTWNLGTITNGMKSGDVITVNSNGVALVDVWMSNSVPILHRHW